MTHVHHQIEREMQWAEAARRAGHEGKARVCARRAAGWAIRAWQVAQNPESPPESALDLLGRAAGDETLPPAVRAAAEHLTLKVTLDYHLPIEADLLEDARLLIAYFGGRMD
jgi:hypothetical protein